MGPVIRQMQTGPASQLSFREWVWNWVGLDDFALQDGPEKCLRRVCDAPL